MISPGDLAFCRRLLAGGSRSFAAAARFLPARYRDPAIALYGFCRLADDEIDEGLDPHKALAGLLARLDNIYAGRPGDTPVDRAFAAVVAAHGIPREVPAALIEGFAWDALQRRYESFEDLLDYATRVAGTVGVMMALVMGETRPGQIARASDLGIAMQLTNIARDVGSDAAIGRIYLPLSWLREAGVDIDAWLASPRPTSAVAGVVARLLEAADEFYLRAERGLNQLPAACRPSMMAARYLYAEIGNEVARRGFDSVSQRAVVSGGRKLLLLGRALWSSLPATLGDQTAPVPAAAFLVNAVAARAPGVDEGARDDAPGLAPWWNFPARIERALELFERLERIQRGLV